MIILSIIIVFVLYRIAINIFRAVHEIKSLTYNINESDVELEKKEDGNI